VARISGIEVARISGTRMHSRFMATQLELLLVGSTFKRINIADIKALVVMVPPIAEQHAICALLDEELRRFDTVIDRAKREIRLMHEYRAQLVSDVVSGQLDVRGAARALPGDEPSATIPDDFEPALLEDEEDLEEIETV
jgi:type I restriction enzyme S subunit